MHWGAVGSLCIGDGGLLDQLCKGDGGGGGLLDQVCMGH